MGFSFFSSEAENFQKTKEKEKKEIQIPMRKPKKNGIQLKKK